MRSRRPRFRRLLPLLCLLLPASLSRVSASPEAGSTELRADQSSRTHCVLENGEVPRYVGEASMDSLGRQLHRHNLRVWLRTDSLYRAGAFGPPGSEEAKNRARIHLQLRVETGMSYIRRLTEGALLWVDETSLRRPFGDVYANYGVYPIYFLRRALAGKGGFCMGYDYPEGLERTLTMGGVRVKAKVERIDPDGDPKIRVLTLDYPTAMHKTVQLLYEPTFCGEVRSERVIDRGDTLDVVRLEGLEGLWVRRWGLHRLAAVAVWRSAVRGERDPANPRVGACAYFPSLDLHLPIFLPNVGLDDLRFFDYPAPVFDFGWLSAEEKDPPDWITISLNGSVSPWEPVGPRPEVLEAAYPDL